MSYITHITIVVVKAPPAVYDELNGMAVAAERGPYHLYKLPKVSLRSVSDAVTDISDGIFAARVNYLDAEGFKTQLAQLSWNDGWDNYGYMVVILESEYEWREVWIYKDGILRAVDKDYNG